MYVSKTGSNTAPYDTWTKAATSPKTAVDYIQSNAVAASTLHIAAGTWDGVDYMYCDSANHTGWTIQGAGMDETIISPSSGHALYGVTADNVTVKDLTLKASGASYAVYKSDGCDGWELDSVELISNPSHTVHLIWNLGDSLDIHHCRINHRYSSSRYSIYYNGDASGDIYFNIIEPPSNFWTTGGVVLYGTGTQNFFNNIVMGTQGQALLTDNGTINADNNYLLGGLLTYSAYTVHKAGGTLNLRNNYIVAGPYNGDSHWVTGSPDIDSGNAETNLSPLFTTTGRTGYLLPCVDDSGNFSYAQSVAAILGTYDMAGSFFIEQASWNTSNNDNLVSMDSDGYLLPAVHSYSHTNLTYSHALNFSQAGGSNCTVAFDGSSITLDCDGTDYDGTLDVTDSNYDTVSEIITALNGTNGWTVAKSSTDGQDDTRIYDNCLASSFATMSATAEPCDIDLDRSGYSTGFFKNEISDPKAWLAGILGREVVSFGAPFNALDTDSRAAIISSGYALGRGSDASGASFPENLAYGYSPDLYYIGSIGATTYLGGTDEAATRKNARALGIATVTSGAIISVLSHNTGELSLDEWGWCLDEWSNIPGLVVTSHDAMAGIVRTGWEDDGDGTYTKTYSESTLTIPSDSPLANAGGEASIVGLTGSQTDFYKETRTFPGLYNLNIGIDQAKFHTPSILGGKILGGYW